MVAELEIGTEKERGKVGFLVRKFLGACELGFRRSLKGTLPKWVAEIVAGECGEREHPGGDSIKTAPVTLFGFTGNEGALVSGIEIEGGAPVLESRAWMALLRMRPLREFWTLELRENHRVQLEGMLAETWVVDPTPVPPHGVIPELGIQDWGDAPRDLGDGRGLALFLPGKLAGEFEIVWGPDAGEEDWTAALARAGEGFVEGKVATVQALPDRPEKAGRVLIG